MNYEFFNDIKDLARRNNPDYSQVTGLIDKDLARKLRVHCAEQDVTIAEVMEEAIADYLEKKQSKRDNNPPTPSINSVDKKKGGEE
jgi:hypothetical protein